MRLIDADKLQKAIPAEEDSITGIGMTYDEMEAYNDGIDEQWKKIVNAPTIEPEQQWIPCSERLPEVGTYVLISKKALNFRSNLPNVCTAHRTHDPRSGKEEWNDMLFGKLNDDDVLAWMPLPEPYTDGEQE